MSVVAVIVAERGARSMRAISPNESPGPRLPTSRSPIDTDAWPSSMTKNVRPPSPSVAIESPVENVRFENSSARRSRWASSNSLKSGTLGRSSVGAAIGG